MKKPPKPFPVPERVIRCHGVCPTCQDADDVIHRWVERWEGGSWVPIYDSVEGPLTSNAGVPIILRTVQRADRP